MYNSTQVTIMAALQMLLAVLAMSANADKVFVLSLVASVIILAITAAGLVIVETRKEQTSPE